MQNPQRKLYAFSGQNNLVQVGKEEVLQKVREWAAFLKKQATTDLILPENSVEKLESIIQDLSLDAEDLPELYTELKKQDEKVVEGSFYSPQDEVEFLVRQSLFHQLSQKFPQILTSDLQALCFRDEDIHPVQSISDSVDAISQFIIQLKVVDPSCGVGNFLICFARIITKWLSLLCPKAELEEKIEIFLSGYISGVDSDPIAVVITRVRLATLFKDVLRLKSGNPRLFYVKNILNLNIAWGNALGTETLQGVLISAYDWVKDSDLKKDYLYLCEKASEIFQNRNSPEKNLQISSDLERLAHSLIVFLRKLNPKKDTEGYFISPIFAWDVNFAHVLRNGGFDVVIGNPPYIRQEDIAVTQKSQSVPWRVRKSDQEGRRENRKFKSTLLTTLSNLANLSDVALSSKADLSAYFFLLAKYLSARGGICGYITPNAWLDVQYGFELQAFLTKHTELLGLYERKYSRAFSAAAINTIITLFVPNPLDSREKGSPSVEIVSLGNDYKEYLHHLTGEKSNSITSYQFQGVTIHSEAMPDHGCRRQILPEELYALGSGGGTGKYGGFKWGSLFFRAPDFFFKFWNRIKSHLMPFLDAIELNFGLKTGKNAFFVVPNKNVKITRKDGEYLLEAPGMENVSVPASALKPIVVSSRKLRTYTLGKQTPSKLLVQIPDDFPPQLAPYIKWGEEKRFHRAPSCQAHHPHWFNLPLQRNPDFIFFRFMDQRMWVPVNYAQYVFSDNFFVGYVRDPSYVKPYAAYFNSTIHLFFSEIWGRTSLGEGLLTFYGPDYKFLEILDPRTLSVSQIQELDRLFDDLSNQPVQPIIEDLQNPARISLDTFIMEKLFNLPQQCVTQLYEAFRALVTQRIGRAKKNTN